MLLFIRRLRGGLRRRRVIGFGVEVTIGNTVLMGPVGCSDPFALCVKGRGSIGSGIPVAEHLGDAGRH